MATTNNKQWGRCTKVHPKTQSFKAYIEGAAEWAKNNLKTPCNICGTETECTDAKIIDNGIVASFMCDSGHITTQTTKESELRRAYNARD